LGDLDFGGVGVAVGEDNLARAWLHAAHGRLSQARAVLTDGAAQARTAGYLNTEALLLTDLARLGGTSQTRLTAIAERCDGQLITARAHFAAAMAGDDPVLLMAAAEGCGDIGAHLLAAEAATAASRQYLRLDQPRAAAAAAHRAAAWAAHCHGARTPALSDTATAVLSDREREIALRAARGMANKDIAAQLTLSVRTVENHLQRAFTKLGITRRAHLEQALTRPQTPGSAE
jgi:DNA-binding CsgD family transcriptional regulator